MPAFATVEADIRCSACGARLRHLVGFQWGYCSVSLGTSIAVYQVGEPLRWRLDNTGSVPRWAYFKGTSAGNFGEPAYGDLLIRESDLFGGQCPGCSHEYVPVGLTLRGGVLKEVRAYPEGLPDYDVFLIHSNGEITPKPEWSSDFHPMTFVDGGENEQLVDQPTLLSK